MVRRNEQDCLLKLLSVICDQRGPVKQKKVENGKLRLVFINLGIELLTQVRFEFGYKFGLLMILIK